jgi:hypothetical protein
MVPMGNAAETAGPVASADDVACCADTGGPEQINTSATPVSPATDAGAQWPLEGLVASHLPSALILSIRAADHRNSLRVSESSSPLVRRDVGKGLTSPTKGLASPLCFSDIAHPPAARPGPSDAAYSPLNLHPGPATTGVCG